MIREITLFSPGDSRSLTCWSNVPCLFARALEHQGIRINRVNIYSNKYIRKLIWDPFCAPIIQRLYPSHAYLYEHTRINRFLTALTISRARHKYIHSDLEVFIGYDYPVKKSNIPCVLLSDWTFEYLITQRRGLTPCTWETEEIKRQNQILEKADCVISLFPDIIQYMKKKYQNPNMYYLGQNVINNADEKPLEANEILNEKKVSNKLLFIGRKPYLPGAKLLISSFQKLQEQYPLLELHIIGLSASDFNRLPENIFCYGYLDKSNDEQRSLYYQLLRNARICINPTPLWAGYSSMIEAMYYYTPIITSRYQSFVDTFGDSIQFGSYLKEHTIEHLASSIHQLLTTDPNTYCQKASLAHQAVKGFTWDSFASKFLSTLNQVIQGKNSQI